MHEQRPEALRQVLGVVLAVVQQVHGDVLVHQAVQGLRTGVVAVRGGQQTTRDDRHTGKCRQGRRTALNNNPTTDGVSCATSETDDALK
jgi:hypothetical protein